MPYIRFARPDDAPSSTRKYRHVATAPQNKARTMGTSAHIISSITPRYKGARDGIAGAVYRIRSVAPAPIDVAHLHHLWVSQIAQAS